MILKEKRLIGEVFNMYQFVKDGGKGSGNFGHAGRISYRGGSAPSKQSKSEISHSNKTNNKQKINFRQLNISAIIDSEKGKQLEEKCGGNLMEYIEYYADNYYSDDCGKYDGEELYNETIETEGNAEWLLNLRLRPDDLTTDEQQKLNSLIDNIRNKNEPLFNEQGELELYIDDYSKLSEKIECGFGIGNALQAAFDNNLRYDDVITNSILKYQKEHGNLYISEEVYDYAIGKIDDIDKIPAFGDYSYWIMDYIQILMQGDSDFNLYKDEKEIKDLFTKGKPLSEEFIKKHDIDMEFFDTKDVYVNTEKTNSELKKSVARCFNFILNSDEKYSEPFKKSLSDGKVYNLSIDKNKINDYIDDYVEELRYNDIETGEKNRNQISQERFEEALKQFENKEIDAAEYCRRMIINSGITKCKQDPSTNKFLKEVDLLKTQLNDLFNNDKDRFEENSPIYETLLFSNSDNPYRHSYKKVVFSGDLIHNDTKQLDEFIDNSLSKKRYAIKNYKNGKRIPYLKNDRILQRYAKVKNKPDIKSNIVDTTEIDNLKLNKNTTTADCNNYIKKIFNTISDDIYVDIPSNKEYLSQQGQFGIDKTQAQKYRDKYYMHSDTASQMQRYAKSDEPYAQPIFNGYNRNKVNGITRAGIASIAKMMTTSGYYYTSAIQEDFEGMGSLIRTIVGLAPIQEGEFLRCENPNDEYRIYDDLKVGDTITMNAQHFTWNGEQFAKGAARMFGKTVFRIKGKTPFFNLNPYVERGKMKEWEGLIAGCFKVKAIQNGTEQNPINLHGANFEKLIELEFDWKKWNNYIKANAKLYCNQIGLYKGIKNKVKDSIIKLYKWLNDYV